MSYLKIFCSKSFRPKFYCFLGISILTFLNAKSTPINDVMLDNDLKASIELIEKKGFMLLGSPNPDPAKTSDQALWSKMNANLGIQLPHPTKNVAAHFQYKITISTDINGKPIYLKINKDGIPAGNGGGLFAGKLNDQLSMEYLQFLVGGTIDADLGVDGSLAYTKISSDNPTFGIGDNGLKTEIFFKEGFDTNFQSISIGHSAKSVCALDRNTVIIVSSTPGTSGFFIWENANGFQGGWNSPIRNILAEKGKFKCVSLSTDKIIFSVNLDGKIAAYGLDGSDKTQALIPNIAEVNNNVFKKICFKGETSGEYSMMALTEDGKVFTATSRKPNKNLTDEGLSNVWDASVSKDGLLLISMAAQSSSGDQKAFGGRTYVGRLFPAPTMPTTTPTSPATTQTAITTPPAPTPSQQPPALATPTPTPPPVATNPLKGNDANAMSSEISKLKTANFDGKTDDQIITFFLGIKADIANINKTLGTTDTNWNTMMEKLEYLQLSHTELI